MMIREWFIGKRGSRTGMASYREAQRRFKQGKDEKIAYKIDVTPWGTAPASPVATLHDETADADASSNLLGVASVSGSNVITPRVVNLVPDHLYLMHVKFMCADGNTYDTFGYIEAEE